MIKFLKSKHGRTLIGLGLSAENIRRLQNNDPIVFNLEELGLEGYDVFITAGETEETIAKDVEQLFGGGYDANQSQ